MGKLINKLFGEPCPCVLPDKIITRKGKKVNVKDHVHDDWPWPFNKVPRSMTTRGPRCKGKECECGGEGYMTWPPKLIRGHNVTRWESDGADSIIEIHALRDRTVDYDYVYGRSFLVTEWNPGNKNFGKKGWITIDWKEGMNVPGQYHPSAVQKLHLGNELISFSARFGGVPTAVSVPPSAVLGIYARENGQGMLFPDEALNS